MIGMIPKASILAMVGKHPEVAIVVNRLLASRRRALTNMFEGLSLRGVVGG